jgi:hypothetical protein
MASSSTPVVNPLCSQTISEKLTKSNHALWKMQVLAIIMGVGLEGYLTKDTSPPAENIRVKNSDGKEEEVPTRSTGCGGPPISRYLDSCCHL